jgi:hypothetical protein
MNKILASIGFTLLGALVALAAVVANDDAFGIVGQLRHRLDGPTWLHPISKLVHARQEVARKALQRNCRDELSRVEQAIFVPAICTTARSKTCIMGRTRLKNGKIVAPLVNEDLWNLKGMDRRFTALGTDALRFDLSESVHVLNEALSDGTVDLDRKLVTFDGEAPAITYSSRIGGVCAALDLQKRSHLILTGETK